MATTKEIVPVVESDTNSDNEKVTKDLGPVKVTETAIDEAKTTSWWRKIVGYVWDSVEGDVEYRRYVQRLDLFFL
jgi:MFS transporter, ACS family, pantothenate transporter